MEPTLTLECTLEMREHLRELEHKLKQIQGLQVFYVEPEDADAPVLISVGIRHKDELADLTIRRITHTLFDFLHGSAREPGQRRARLVTIEGDNVDLEPLSSSEIKQVITEAYEGQA
ncbi:MAG TPA: hypothetical protein VGD98_24900 [Ktedonobacteraceae bacterium]